jgi:hypothetical protein
MNIEICNADLVIFDLFTQTYHFDFMIGILIGLHIQPPSS